ncbi:hypothetical protein OIU79_011379 [Salix purpurea]|uniref:Zinc-finger domain-containing protein n=1 Tax=Salix purpurea TaxID=77065 RepID=A0A9Q0Q0K1_SALPP|nr:hypothetical protein OIU79_011379 [Salix purpurea]
MKSHQTDKETEERRRNPSKENSLAAMAVSSTPADSNGKEFVEKSRTKCPGVPAVGGRIHDSQNGKNCHQCRQKTLDFAAVCTTQKGNKLCTLKFCHKCLLNRYGEKAEELLHEETRSQTHWHACSHRQGKWVFLCLRTAAAHNLKSDVHVHRHLGGLLVGLIRKLLLLWWWLLKRWRGCYCGGGESRNGGGDRRIRSLQSLCHGN